MQAVIWLVTACLSRVALGGVGGGELPLGE